MTDLIDRQAAIDVLDTGLWGVEWDKALATAMLKDLPSAERKGHYIGTQYDGYADGCPVYNEWVCSECGCVFEDEEPTYNYCPLCGARMEREDG